MKDQTANSKLKLISTLFDMLLAGKVEQETFILEILINKLGDPDFQIATKVMHEIKKFSKKNRRNSFWNFLNAF